MFLLVSVFISVFWKKCTLLQPCRKIKVLGWETINYEWMWSHDWPNMCPDYLLRRGIDHFALWTGTVLKFFAYWFLTTQTSDLLLWFKEGFYFVLTFVVLFFWIAEKKPFVQHRSDSITRLQSLEPDSVRLLHSPSSTLTKGSWRSQGWVCPTLWGGK